MCKYLSNTYPIQDGMKHGDMLSIFTLNSLSVTKVQANQSYMELYGAHEISVYAAGSLRAHNRLSPNSTHSGQSSQFH
jgi:hypothetical protein